MTYNEINILVTLANRNPQFFSLEGNDLHEHNHIHEKECNHDYHFHKSIGYTCDMNKVCCNNTVAIIQKEEEFYEKMKRN